MPGSLNPTAVLDGSMDYLQERVVTEEHVCGGEQRGQNVHAAPEPARSLVALPPRISCLVCHQPFQCFRSMPALASSCCSLVRSARMLSPPFTRSPTFT